MFFFVATRGLLAADEVGVEEKLGQRVPVDLVFNDETGAPVTLKSLLGKPTILTLVYYECPGICTPLLNNLVNTLDGVDLTPGKDYQVLTISFDPRDTSATASKKRENYLKQFHRPVPPEAWRFLTGNQAAIDQITAAVGFHFKKVGQDFNHPGVIMVLSPDGRMMRYLQGTSFLPFDIKMAVIEASKGHQMATVNRVLSFCFAYDPQGRTYVFSTLKVVGSVMVVFIGMFVTWLVISTRSHRKESTTHGI
jgi:protein SCO1/2